MWHSGRMTKKESYMLRFVSFLESKHINKIQNVTYQRQSKRINRSNILLSILKDSAIILSFGIDLLLVVALCFSGVLETDNKLIIADICVFKCGGKLL